MKEYTDSNYFFIKLILKWKNSFLIITIASTVIAGIFSSEFFIKPKYTSNAIVYPSNLIPYSEESPSEQLLQLIQASEVRDGVIKKFNLAKHYNLDTAQKSGKSALISEYISNIQIKRTPYESIEIKATDTDPLIAKDMVLEIINGLNLKARTLQREKTKEVLNMYENQLQLKRKQVDSLNTILQELRVKYQLLDYNIQAKEATKSFLKAASSGSRKENLKDADMLLRNLEQKGGLFFEVTQSYYAVLNSYNNTKLEYDNTYKDLHKELTYTSIVEEPLIPDTKSFPVRWLIVLTSLVSANVFLFLVLLLFEKRKEII